MNLIERIKTIRQNRTWAEERDVDGTLPAYMESALLAAGELADAVCRNGYRVDEFGNTTLLDADAMMPINKALAAFRKAIEVE